MLLLTTRKEFTTRLIARWSIANFSTFFVYILNAHSSSHNLPCKDHMVHSSFWDNYCGYNNYCIASGMEGIWLSKGKCRYVHTLAHGHTWICIEYVIGLVAPTTSSLTFVLHFRSAVHCTGHFTYCGFW